MNARNALLPVSALLALTAASCGTVNRAGKDLMLGIGTPVLMIYGGATDGYATSVDVREGLDSGGAVQVLSFPFTFFYHAAEHFIYGVAHLVDLPLCVFYGAAELSPYGPEVKPLDIYRGTIFDDWAAKRFTHDAMQADAMGMKSDGMKSESMQR